MTDQAKLEELERRIDETRTLLDELQKTARQLREKRQHEAIDQLEELFPDTSLLGPLAAECRELIARLKHMV
ncbi:hypothetical protein ACGTN6_13825 [Halomonas sp. THAF12]|uniref:hypothetical protein n=1 Tax=Halomonas sp. B23F22_10 TaxID=3459515 RepID=UPI00373E4CBE